jgi:hypothetical protein
MSLFVNFKDTNGNVTSKGKLVLIIMLLALLVGVATTIAESNVNKKEAQEQLARTTKVLHEFNRTQSPITKLQITYWLLLPTDYEEVNSYMKKVDSFINKNFEELYAFPSTIDLPIISVDIKKNPTVAIKRDSKFWPTTEKKLISILNTYTFSVYIRKDPIDPAKFFPMVSTNPGYSDFVALAIIPDDNRLNYAYSDKRLEIFNKQSYDTTVWKTNGKISSLIDLEGAQIFLVPSYSSTLDVPDIYNIKLEKIDTQSLSKHIEIRTLLLSFSNGHEIWVDGACIKKSSYKNGFPVFSITLPSRQEEFVYLTKSIDSCAVILPEK